MVDGRDANDSRLGEYTELLDGPAIRYLFEIGGRTVRLNCRVRGRVQHLRSMKNVAFTTLDVTAGLQLVFDRHVLSEQQFNECLRLREGARIEAWIDTEFEPTRTPPIRLIVRSFASLPAGQMAERRSSTSVEQAQSRIYLASIARSVADYLTRQNWVEVEPLTISTTLSQSVDPLLVIFPGLGAETSLVVSPIAELAEIAQVTGASSVFAVSRIYSRAIRDGFTSPESLAVHAVRIAKSTEAQIDLALVEGLLTSAFEPVKSRLSQREREWLSSHWERRSSKSIAELREVPGPVHEIATVAEGIVFRSVWPHPISIIEGHVRVGSDGALHSATVHCERIMHLVSDVHYRRLQDSPRLT